MLNRREVLNLAVSAGAASALLPARRVAADIADAPFRIVDSNVSLFQWPFRRLPLDNIDLLVAKLHTLGIAQAWAGSFEGLLHRDVATVNLRLADACRNRPELTPIGSVNLELPNWEEDVRKCFDNHGMPGIRLHPNYHGYTLDDPRFARLLELATTARRLVQIAVSMEDIRTQLPLLPVPDVDLGPLPDVLPSFPKARVQILNHRLRPSQAAEFAGTPGVYFDTARVDATDGVPNLVNSVPPGRVLFGSHAPFLIPEAALIRVHESGLLDEVNLRSIYSENAEAVFGRNAG